MDDPTRLAIEEAFKLALNASLGLKSSTQHIAFVAEHLRAQADEKPLPSVPESVQAGSDRAALVTELLKSAQTIETALGRALNRAARLRHHVGWDPKLVPPISRVVEEGPASAPVQHPLGPDAILSTKRRDAARR